MRTVYKYQFGLEGKVLPLPVGSKVVCVGQQEERITVWIEQDIEKDPYDFHFYIVPTGSDVPFGTFYVGTSFIGPFVWHIYQSI
jgi:hypothetical protein